MSCRVTQYILHYCAKPLEAASAQRSSRHVVVKSDSTPKFATRHILSFVSRRKNVSRLKKTGPRLCSFSPPASRESPSTHIPAINDIQLLLKATLGNVFSACHVMCHVMSCHVMSCHVICRVSNRLSGRHFGQLEAFAHALFHGFQTAQQPPTLLAKPSFSRRLGLL